MKNNWIRKFNNELPVFAWKLPTEILVGFLLGTIPVIFNSSTNAQVEEIVKGLLATKQVMDHAFYLLIPYFFVCLHKGYLRFKSDRANDRFNFIYKMANEIGTSFLAIARTGFGAIFGFFLASICSESGAQSNGEIFEAAAYSVLTLILSVGLSLFLDFLSSPPNSFKTKRNIILDTIK